MRSFKDNYTVEISVDSIAQKLLSLMKDNNTPYVERVVESIIGTALDTDRLGTIYHTLMGLSLDIDLEIGEHVLCSHVTYMYKTPESREKKDSQRSELGLCQVVDINPYKKDQVLVEYDYYNVNGDVIKTTMWVRYNECKRTAVPELYQ